ncbi:MAG: hypothetical protein P1V97_23230 [Planctomycetota bacterium]|nr:hypothetical protein [Planctomycetota bacterium]
MKTLLDDACDILWELRGALEENQNKIDNDELEVMHEQTLRALSLIYRARKSADCHHPSPPALTGLPQS